jgi:hypothetical protein
MNAERESNAEGRMRNAEWKTGRRVIRSLLVLYSAFCIPHCALVSAAPTQDEVFRSIEQNVGQSGDSGSFLGVLLACLGAVVLLLVIVNYARRRSPGTRTRPGTPSRARVVNHHGKLMKEVARAAHLRPREVKRLKAMAERVGESRGEPLASPLVLLLCPSLLRKSDGEKE